MFEFFREINQVYALVALFAFVYKARNDFQATWAKARYRRLVQSLLVLVGSAAALLAMGSSYHEHIHSQATWLSPMWFAWSTAMLVFALKWPKPKKMRRCAVEELTDLPNCDTCIFQTWCDNPVD